MAGLVRQSLRRWWQATEPLRADRNFGPVLVLTLAIAALYAAAGLALHAGFRTALLDLGIYDQAMQGYARFGLPRVPVLGLVNANDGGPLHWTDHFTPILVVLTPFYWIHRGPETLLVAEGVLFALAIPPLWVFTRRALGVVAAYVIAVAYGLSWPIQEAVWFPFHQVAFAVPLMALMLERFQAGQFRHAAVASLFLLGVREDLGLVVSVLGVLILMRGERRLGWKLAIGGVVATWFFISVLMPILGASPRRNWTYWHFGESPTRLALALLKSPLASLEYMLTPPEKVRTLLWLFGPTLFLALRSRLTWLAVPLLVVRFLSEKAQHWTLHFHYNAFVVIIILCAAVESASRLPTLNLPRGVKLRSACLWVAAVALVAVVTLPRFPAWAMTKRSFWYPRTDAVRAMQDALAVVPDGVLVAAFNPAGAHLTRRAKVILLVPPGDRYELEAEWELRGLSWKFLGDRKRAEAPWIVTDVARRQFPFESVEQQQAHVRKLLARGYTLVYERDGYVVLHRSKSHGGA